MIHLKTIRLTTVNTLFTILCRLQANCHGLARVQLNADFDEFMGKKYFKDRRESKA